MRDTKIYSEVYHRRITYALPSRSLTLHPLKSHQNPIGSRIVLSNHIFFKGYVIVKLRGVVHISVQHVNMWKCKGGYEVDSQDIVSTTRSSSASPINETQAWLLMTYAILIMPKPWLLEPGDCYKPSINNLLDSLSHRFSNTQLSHNQKISCFPMKNKCNSLILKTFPQGRHSLSKCIFSPKNTALTMCVLRHKHRNDGWLFLVHIFITILFFMMLKYVEGGPFKQNLHNKKRLLIFNDDLLFSNTCKTEKAINVSEPRCFLGILKLVV